MEQLLGSIYDSYNRYKVIAEGILGKDSPFVDDVLSNCIIKIYEIIKSGRLSVEDLTYEDNGINQTYFKSMVLNAALDFKGRKVNRDTFYINEKTPRAEFEDEEEAPFADVYLIQKFLYDYEVVNVHNKFRADLFRLHYLEGISINQLHLSTGINRPLLTTQKKLILKEVSQWLKEQQKNQQLKF